MNEETPFLYCPRCAAPRYKRLDPAILGLPRVVWTCDHGQPRVNVGQRIPVQSAKQTQDFVVPMFVVDRSTLGAQPPVTHFVQCPHCDGEHGWSQDQDDSFRTYYCPVRDKTYLGALEGKMVTQLFGRS
jgi:hypothetical protein